jgi:hypothetical protein
MARLKPPRHKIVETGIYISPDDDAWDMERIEREAREAKDEHERTLAQAAELEERGGHEEAKQLREKAAEDGAINLPFARYLFGETRYQLDGVREYLDESKRPEKWYLRRLPEPDFYELKAMREESVRAGSQSGFDASHRLAAKRGIVRCENGPEIKLDARGYVTAESMEKIRRLDDELILQLGQAVMEVSKGLTEAEKKA